jgi:hypothetical protein
VETITRKARSTDSTAMLHRQGLQRLRHRRYHPGLSRRRLCESQALLQNLLPLAWRSKECAPSFCIFLPQNVETELLWGAGKREFERRARAERAGCKRKGGQGKRKEGGEGNNPLQAHRYLHLCRFVLVYIPVLKTLLLAFRGTILEMGGVLRGCGAHIPGAILPGMCAVW